MLNNMLKVVSSICFSITCALGVAAPQDVTIPSAQNQFEVFADESLQDAEDTKESSPLLENNQPDISNENFNLLDSSEENINKLSTYINQMMQNLYKILEKIDMTPLYEMAAQIRDNLEQAFNEENTNLLNNSE